MARPLFLGNGSMLVGLDKSGLVHDFYYPYVGQENHASETTMHHRIGVYVDGSFSWLDDSGWDIKINYEPDAMIGHISAVNQRLKVALEFHDFVDHEYNVFGRNIHVVNNDDREREVRVFMHQVFRISGSNRGDTAMFVPDGHYILDYKDKRTFLIYGEKSDGESFDQYSVGIHGIEGQAGTFADAEDGDLSQNAVEHGSVDSTIRFSCNLPAVSSKRLSYWIVSAASHPDALNVHQKLTAGGFNDRYRQTQLEWRKWLARAEGASRQIPRNQKERMKQSLLIMKSHMDRRGAILASGDSEMLNYARDNYSYCWPRDAAYVLWPLLKLGYKDEAKAFFEFARDVLSDNGSLMHKYQPDRAVGSTWHPLVHKGRPELAIQEDETAIAVYMLEKYLTLTEDEDFVARLYNSFVKPAANFLENYIDKETSLPHASYDLWEEKFGTSTYTTASTYAGLKAAAKIAENFEHPDDAIRWQTVADELLIAAHKQLFNTERGYFYKGLYLNEGAIEFDATIDTSSLYGAVKFGLFDPGSEQVTTSIKTLEDTLLNKSTPGGLPRYEHDSYYSSNRDSLGNPWFVTTLWLAQVYIIIGRKADAQKLISWTEEHMLKSGALSEQIDATSGKPLSVTPLIWSQAEYVRTLLYYYS